MIRILLIAAIASPMFLGCTSPDNSRTRLNQSSASATINEDLSLNVSGASILEVVPGNLEDVTEIPHVNIRAQSFDVRVDVRVATCSPEVIHLTLTHMDPTISQATVRTFLDGSDASTEASRTAVAGGLTLDSDPHDPTWTPLEAEHPFAVESAQVQPAHLTWTLCADRSRRVIKLHSGHVGREVCGFPEPLGACAEANPETANDLGAATLVVRHRVQTTLPSTYRLAVWGNNASNAEIQDQIINAVNESSVHMAIINGDLTDDGSSAGLEAARSQLDSGLNMPWTATLGDRDISGFAAIDYIKSIGSSHFAFDAGPVRIAVVDSADRAIGADNRRLLRSWLDGISLGWETPAPTTSIVITHVPPFDAYGTRDLALKDRSEAASISATLKRSGVVYTLTSQLGRYLIQSDDGIRVVHSGGGGGPMESTSEAPHHWLLVTVDHPCAPDAAAATTCTTTDGITSCICVRLERRDL